MRDLVMAAVDVLAKAGADVSEVSIPEHHAIRMAQAALSGEGALALFNTGFFGAFTRTYYPASSSPPSIKCGPPRPTCLRPHQAVAHRAELSRRTYHGRVYAKAQNVRPTYIKAYDTALAGVDVLVMPTCIMTAPRTIRRIATSRPSRTTSRCGAAPATPNPSTTLATRRSPCLWQVVGRSPGQHAARRALLRRPASRARTPTSTQPTGMPSSASRPEQVRTGAPCPSCRR